MGTCCVILGHVTWALARSGRFPFEQPKQLHGCLPGTLRYMYMRCMYLYTRICKLVTHSIKKFAY